MYLFDSSSMIHAWDNYPIEAFPSLWDWMAVQIHEEGFRISRIVFEEIQRKIPECAYWIKQVDGEHIAAGNEVLQVASLIKSELGIKEDGYHPKGVGENDILIIATAKVHELVLISDEGRQLVVPKESAKQKIPAVCKMAAVNVQCINFIELIKTMKVRFV